jgi:hypothetical protein
MSIVSGKQVILKEIESLASESAVALKRCAGEHGREVMLYLHWTAGHYHQFYDDYHLNIDADGSVYLTTSDFAELKAHTWQRNSGAVGLALAAGAFATMQDLGNAAPTSEQIEAMAQVIAVLCTALNIPIDDRHVLTHAEAANEDGYGPDSTCERWDLWFLSNGAKEGSGGPILRGKAKYYQNQFKTC